MIRLTKWRAIWLVVILTIVANVALYLFTSPVSVSRDFSQLKGDADHGNYLLRLGGCVACHTDVAKQGAFLAGGAPIKTPFGSFYAPNISSDQTHGLGSWTLEQFVSAMSDGRSPSKEAYYPVLHFLMN